MLVAIRDFLREPRPKVTEDVMLDRRITFGLMVVIVFAAYIDVSHPNRLVAGLIGIATTYALRWFRRHAFWLTVGVAGLFIALWEWGWANSIFGFAISFYSFATVYALARWGSGREIGVGSAAVLVAGVYPSLGQSLPWGELVIFSLWALYPLGFGLAARSSARMRQQALTAARLHERHEIARELHDTVAHHVSAITIQAQAARTILETKPDTARSVLENIEEQAARALDEMRRMVTVLRDSEAKAEMRPQSGLDDIASLATVDGPGPPIEVTLSGELGHLAPSLQASLFRLAQEGVTNARRHARRATQIHVEIVGHQDRVDLTVRDDGEPKADTTSAGFGLTGLAERATQLGGTFSAGPEVQGWAIRASLPATAPA